MVVAAIGEFVDEGGVGVEVEDDGRAGGEEGVEVAVGEAVGVFGVGLEAVEIDYVDEADFEVGEVLAENGGCGEGFLRGDVAGAGHDDVGFGAVVGGGPVPDPDALGAVLDGGVFVEVLEVRLFVGDDDVDVVDGAEAVVGYGEEAVGVGRKVDAGDGGGLVGDDVEEAGVLVGEAVVVLAPDERGDEEVDGGDGGAPGGLFFGGLEPLGVLVVHGVDDVDEGLVG